MMTITKERFLEASQACVHIANTTHAIQEATKRPFVPIFVNAMVNAPKNIRSWRNTWEQAAKMVDPLLSRFAILDEGRNYPAGKSAHNATWKIGFSVWSKLYTAVDPVRAADVLLGKSEAFAFEPDAVKEAWPRIVEAFSKWPTWPSSDILLSHIQAERDRVLLALDTEQPNGHIAGVGNGPKIRTDISADDLLAIRPTLDQWPDRIHVCNAMIAERCKPVENRLSDQKIAEQITGETGIRTPKADTILKYIRDRVKDYRATADSK